MDKQCKATHVVLYKPSWARFPIVVRCMYVAWHKHEDEEHSCMVGNDIITWNES